MANSNIFAQYVKPVRSVQEYAQDYDLAEQNQLALGAKRMEMQRAQRGEQTAEQRRRAFASSGGDGTAYRNALSALGDFEGVTAFDAQEQARKKAEAELGKVGADTKGKEAETQERIYKLAKQKDDDVNMALGALANDPQLSLGKVTGVLQGLLSAGRITPQFMEAALKDMPDDPNVIRGDLLRKVYRQFKPEELIKLYTPDIKYEGTGARKIPVNMNPNSIGYTAPQPLTMEQTPDSVASNARQAADAAAGRAVTIRGQNLTDSRAREATTATLTKPFEVTGPDGTPMLVQQDKQGNIRPVQGYGPKAGIEKPLNDTQSKALLFGSRMREAGKVLDELEKSGTTTSVPGSRAGYGVGSVVTALSSSQKQQLDQAKRDFVNAVLRRESGAVIADSEFDNADKQYFPQIGDSAAVIAQKRRNRELATQGILQEVPENRRNGLKPQPTLPTADDIRKQADNILKGG